MFQPRYLSAKRVCCSNPVALCKVCRTHHGVSYDPLYAAVLDEHIDITNKWHAEQQLRAACAGTASCQRDTEMPYAPAPNPYAEDLQRLRAATGAPAETFEDRWKADRLRAMYATRAALDAMPMMIPRLTAAERAELATYAAPDGYALALRALEEAR